LGPIQRTLAGSIILKLISSGSTFFARSYATWLFLIKLWSSLFFGSNCYLGWPFVLAVALLC
jgi:hypothetical protein